MCGSVAWLRWRACADAGVPVARWCSVCLLPSLPIVPLPHATAHALTPFCKCANLPCVLPPSSPLPPSLPPPQTGTSAPLVTVTTSMNPVDVLNPSDDYIWQILFAGENDAVPKRVTGERRHCDLHASNVCSCVCLVGTGRRVG